MAKLTINDVTSGYVSTTAINTAFTAIETALENTLSRDGTSPNQMSANLDMNGYAVLNARATTGNENFLWLGTWATGSSYSVNNLVYAPEGTNEGNTLICVTAHIAGATLDGDAAKWAVFTQRGASGNGTGDVVGPASATPDSLARYNGTTGKLLKDGAVIGTHVQAYNDQLTTLAGITAQQATDLASISAFVGTVMNDATPNDVLTTLTATRAEAGATAVTVLNALRRVVSVKDFGAVGDGAADDTTKIQAALDAVGTTGGAVFFPLGVYKTTATLKFGSGTTIHGIGIDSLIKGESVAGPLFQSTGGSTARRYRLVMRDLGIDNTTTVAGGIGLDLRNVSDSKLDNVFISNVETGVQFYADAGLGCYYNTLKDVSVASCVKGFWFGARANENRLIACRTNGTTEPVVLSDGSHNHIISCAFEGFGTYGINISGPAYDTLILSPRLENAPTAGTGIRVVSTAVRTTIIAPQYTGLTTNLDDAATNSVILSGQDGFKFGEAGAKNRFHKRATASLDFASIAAHATADLSIALTGAAKTDTVSVTPDAAVPSGVMFMAVPGAGLVYVRAANVTAAAIDLAALTFTVDAWGN